MISDKMTAAINDQIKTELDSTYIYLSMAAYPEAKPVFRIKTAAGEF